MAASNKAFAELLKDREVMDGSGFSLAQPFRQAMERCKRRWVDYQRLRASDGS